MKNKISIKILHLTIIVLGTLFIFSSVFHTNMWFDEAYSVGMANQTVVDIWKIGANDVHPILYYWMLRLVNILTKGSILAYRSFSALPIALLGILGITHIKKDFGEKTGILFSFFTYFLPMIAVYANQMRMYSWAIYIVTILSIHTYRIYNGQNTKKNWLIFGITSLASLYIHYYGMMAAGLINLFLLIHIIRNKKWKDLKWQLGLGLIQVVLYVPWLICLMSQMKSISGGFWISFTFPTTIYEIIGCQMNGSLNTEAHIFTGFLINVMLFIILTIVALKNRKNKNFDLKAVKYASLIYISVIVAATIVTVFLKTSILLYRYLYVITGLYIFVLSYILAESKNKYVVITVCAIVLCLGVYNNIVQIKTHYSKENNKPIEYLKENVKEGDVFVYNEVGSGFICASIFANNKQYFYNKENWGVEEAYKAWAPQLETCVTTEFIDNCTGRVWVIGAWNNSCYEELFNNEKFNKISNKYFTTQYQNYPYNITLVERVK